MTLKTLIQSMFVFFVTCSLGASLGCDDPDEVNGFGPSTSEKEKSSDPSDKTADDEREEAIKHIEIMEDDPEGENNNTEDENNNTEDTEDPLQEGMFAIENGVGQVSPTSNTGFMINKGASVTVDIDQPVTCISQETLISFIENNSSFFTKEEMNTLTQHEAYMKRGFGSDLFLAMLGIKLKGDVDAFRNSEKVTLSPKDDTEAQFISAVSALQNQEYNMTGKRTAYGLSAIQAVPYFYAGITNVYFPGNRFVRAVNTHLYVMDENGSSNLVAGKKNEAALSLIAVDAEDEGRNSR